MSQGGTWAERKTDEQAKLQAQFDKWMELRLNPNGWRMGDNEFLFRCELLTIIEVLREHYDISQDELDTRLARIMREQLEELLPQVQEQRAAEIRAQLTRGINGSGPIL